MKKRDELNHIANCPTLYLDEKPTLRGKELKSYIIYFESLDENISRNPKYVQITRNLYCSPIEQEARKYWFKHSEKYNAVLSKLTKHIPDSIKKQEAEKILDWKDKIADGIIREQIYPIVKPELIAEYKIMYPKSWKKKLKKINKPYYHFKYDRIINLPGVLKVLGGRDYLSQIFYVKDGKKEFIVCGYNSSSGGRQHLSLMGEAFAEHNEKVAIPTEIFVYNSRNILKHIASYKQLVLIPGVCIMQRDFPHLEMFDLKKCKSRIAVQHPLTLPFYSRLGIN
ncbi:MAG: hypothetical protein HY919_07385 [Elusimicrobia bacterium]|nr:hypothetical protein [Elusimicrobiota bacterium]